MAAEDTMHRAEGKVKTWGKEAEERLREASEWARREWDGMSDTVKDDYLAAKHEVENESEQLKERLTEDDWL